MTKLLCAVYDSVSKVYAPPFCAVTRGDALRSFGNAVNDRNMGDLCKHPKDFLLYCLGTFDDNKGEIVATIPPDRLGIGSDFVETVGPVNKQVVA